MPARPVVATAVEIVLGPAQPKAHSVRYDAPARSEGDPRPALSSIYLDNEAFALLGSPQSIRVSVSAAS